MRYKREKPKHWQCQPAAAEDMPEKIQRVAEQVTAALRHALEEAARDAQQKLCIICLQEGHRYNSYFDGETCLTCGRSQMKDPSRHV